jgi:hypothetical protein
VARRTVPTKDKRDAKDKRSGGAARSSTSRARGAKGAPVVEAARANPRPSKRYTPPIPRSKRHSPKWLLGVIGFFLLLGLALIVLNYMTVLPDSPTNWYLLGGLVSIAIAFVTGTQYH